MSARNVCSGTRPSEYVSLRDISPPPSRPPHEILTPCAPDRIAEARERFIARRKLTRFSSCSATDWATSFASSSGRLISLMLMWTLLWVSAWISLRSASTSAPDFPITIPGRAV